MHDRNFWDPATPQNYTNFTRSARVVDLNIFSFALSAKNEEQVRQDVERAREIWCQAQINIQAHSFQRLPLFRDPDLDDQDLARRLSCPLAGNFAQRFFEMAVPELGIALPANPDITTSIAVFYIPGQFIQGVQGVKGCHQFRFTHEGNPQHIIVLTDSSDGTTLSHELGHALFTHNVGPAQWNNHDPDPNANAADRIHNTDAVNLMNPNVPPVPVITQPQIALAQQCALTRTRDLAFGFMENKSFSVRVSLTSIGAEMTSDELFSDDSLESEWTFAVSITDAGGGIVTRSTWPWTKDPFHGGTPYSLGFVFGPNALPSVDHNIRISVTGKDKDYFPFNPDDQLPSIEKNCTFHRILW